MDPDPPPRKQVQHDDHGEPHFLTFSCDRRLPLWSKDRTRQWFVEALDPARAVHGFPRWAWVILPEHVHVLPWHNLIARLVTVTIRPCLMTTVTTILGLAPIFLDSGRGSDFMPPMAISSVGGMSIALITLFVIPCCYCLIKEWQLQFQRRAGSDGK